MGIRTRGGVSIGGEKYPVTLDGVKNFPPKSDSFMKIKASDGAHGVSLILPPDL
jgi:hypothetical protein